MKAFMQSLISLGPWGVFVFAFIDSAGVPNPSGTDALLLLVTIERPEYALLCAGLAILGSLLGSLFFYQIIRKGGEKFLDRYTTAGKGARFRIWFQRYGMASVFVAALLPVPFLPLKALAACACAMGVSRARFVLVMAAARIPRYAGLAYLGAQLGENSSAWIKAHTWHMTALAVVLLALLYALLKWNDRNSPAGRGSTIV